MRPRLIVVTGIAAVLALGLFVARGDDGPDAGSRPSLEAQTVTAGAVDVRLAPHHVDGSGAAVEVTLDTHATELSMDLVGGATLTVGGRTWPATGWEGDGPSGHHREGVLTFEATGPASGEVTLELDGFDAPVSATWATVGA